MSTAENTYLTYLHILQNTSCFRKPEVISGRGGGTPRAPSPRSTPELAFDLHSDSRLFCVN